MKDYILEVKDLHKTFRMKNGMEVNAVRGISFQMERGEIFGFLGPNGAGKSTTINMLTTGLKADSGEILVDGKSAIRYPEEARAKIGVVAQHNNLDRSLTARENLLFHADYFGMASADAQKKADEYLEKFGLADRQNDYVRSFSGGMSQRLKIARAMMHTPEILFLDEPTTGLDPNYREILWEQMLELNRKGTTIFLTTHYMEEPERFCNNIAIISHGELKASGTADALKSMIPSRNIVTLKLDRLEESFLPGAESLKGVQKAKIQDGALLLYMEHRQPDFDSIIRWTEENGCLLKNISLSTSTLDDVFVYLTGNAINSAWM